MQLGRSVWSNLLLALLVVFGLLHLVQVASPLRLNYDVIHYLLMAASAADGQGFLMEGRPTHYPAGYSAFVALLDMLGLGASAAIVLGNVVFVGVGLAATWLVVARYLGVGHTAGLAICVLMFGSWVTIKHVTLPVPEALFFALLATCLLCLARASQRPWGEGRRWLLWVGAVVLAIAAIFVRSAGIALLPALAMAAMPLSAKDRMQRAATRRRLLIVGLGAAMGFVAAAIYMIATSPYLDEWTGHVSRFGFLGHLKLSARLTLIEVGETVLNAPYDRIVGQWPALDSVFRAAGLAGLALVVAGLWVRRRMIGPLEVFAISYIGLMVVWLSIDARFWMPVLPLFATYAWFALREVSSRAVRIGVGSYGAWFVLWAFLALGFSTRLSIASAESFMHRYGDGALTPSYEAALGLVDPAELRMVQRRGYEAVVRFGRADQIAQRELNASPREP